MKRKNYFNLCIISFVLIVSIPGYSYAQSENDKGRYDKLEALQDQNEGLYLQIYNVLKNNPGFSYHVERDKDGKVKEVIVSGVNDQKDSENLKVWIINMLKNRENMKNIPTRTGIYYSLDTVAKPKKGESSFRKELQDQLTYPDEASDVGVGGVIYAKFVVDSKGEIPYISTTADINTYKSMVISDMEDQIVKAIELTSGDWIPAKYNGKYVASYVIVPVYFDFQKNPALPLWFP